MSSKPTYLITDPVYQHHLTGPGHPESPDRYACILSSLRSLNLKLCQARDATEKEILLCHTPGYLNLLKKDAAACAASEIIDGSFCISTGDVQICPESFNIALRAVGGVLSGIDAVLLGEAQNAFCLIRPPGHHACSDRGMGFCLFNNIAIGARYAQLRYQIRNILIVDWDVHHGNGTQEIFYTDPSIFYFSTHQSHHYPGTGSEEEVGSGLGIGTVLNCPIAPGEESRAQILHSFQEKLVPAMEKYKPELVMVSAGFDAHFGDPLGRLNLTDEDFSLLTEIVKNIARQYSGGRIVSALEGGYNLQAVASAAKAHVYALMNQSERI
jgi:acetoin utilization deacetylase AcuC-like enzyme